MSGKYKSKKANARKRAAAKKRRNQRIVGCLIAIVIVLLLILLTAIVYLMNNQPGEAIDIPANTQTVPTQSTAAQETEKVQIDDIEEVSIVLNGQMQIEDIGKYTGIYMEDGSDEVVSGILMMVVRNISEETIQYAEIDLTVGEETAGFSLSTLPPGEAVVLLEKNRMAYSSDVDYFSSKAEARNVATTQQPLSLYEDKLKIQTLDGAINITNISGEDITQDIFIYYKNSASDLYYGGITYRITLEGGLKADEIRQIMASHFSQNGSKIMFVSFGA